MRGRTDLSCECGWRRTDLTDRRVIWVRWETGVKEITEGARPLPVVDRADVIVAGGGIAGVAAAVAAARNGARVCLLEKAFGLGGLATLGNVTVYLPICDGMGRQVMGGLAEELLHLSVRDLQKDNSAARFRGVPACWRAGGDVEERRKTRYRVDFNPAAYQLALVELLQGLDVKILYDTRVCAVQRESGLVRHVIVENKSGRSALACGAVIDATGDADICHLAGEQTESLDSNVLAGWFYTLSDGRLKLRAMSNRYSADATREGGEGPFFRGDDAAQVTAQVLGSQEMMRRTLADLRERSPDSAIEPIMIPSIPCMRMTRRLVGAVSLTEADMHVWQDDMVGYTSDWRRRGPVYAIPLRSLCGVSNRNLLAVGRCMSADTTVWDVTRAIPCCVLTGEAAGTAAAIAVSEAGGDVSAVAVATLQDQLKKQGGLLQPELVAPAISPEVVSPEVVWPEPDQPSP